MIFKCCIFKPENDITDEIERILKANRKSGEVTPADISRVVSIDQSPGDTENEEMEDENQ